MPHRTYALVVGVERYPLLGGVGAPGALNDVTAIQSALRVLGVTEQDTCTLTSPAPDGDGGPDLASRRHILEAFAALIRTLRADPDARGIFTFSGLGAQVGGELMLCPCDVHEDGTLGGGVKDAISFAELRQILSDRREGDHALGGLTLVLDCCYAGDATETGLAAHARTLTAGPLPHVQVGPGYAALAAGSPDDRIVVLSASEEGELAYALDLGPVLGRPDAVHGVFTAGMMALFQRWSCAPGPTLNLNYGELIGGLRGSCAALHIPQRPSVTGSAGLDVDRLAVLRFHETRGTPPTVLGLGRELSGGMDDALVGDILKAGAYQGFFVCKWTNGAPDNTVFATCWVNGTQTGVTYPVATNAVGLQSSYPAPNVPAAPPANNLLPTSNTTSYYDIFPVGGGGSCLGSVVLASGQVIWMFYGSAWPSSFQLQVVSGGNAAVNLRNNAKGLVVSSTSYAFGSAAVPVTGTVQYEISQTGTGAKGWLYTSGNSLTWWRQDAGSAFGITSTAPLVFKAYSSGFSGNAYKATDPATT